jgi:hypothetical protein
MTRAALFQKLYKYKVVSTLKLRITLATEKASHKMLVKLTLQSISPEVIQNES